MRPPGLHRHDCYSVIAGCYMVVAFLVMVGLLVAALIVLALDK